MLYYFRTNVPLAALKLVSVVVLLLKIGLLHILEVVSLVSLHPLLLLLTLVSHHSLAYVPVVRLQKACGLRLIKAKHIHDVLRLNLLLVLAHYLLVVRIRWVHYRRVRHQKPSLRRLRVELSRSLHHIILVLK